MRSTRSSSVCRVGTRPRETSSSRPRQGRVGASSIRSAGSAITPRVGSKFTAPRGRSPSSAPLARWYPWAGDWPPLVGSCLVSPAPVARRCACASNWHKVCTPRASRPVPPPRASPASPPPPACRLRRHRPAANRVSSCRLLLRAGGTHTCSRRRCRLWRGSGGLPTSGGADPPCAGSAGASVPGTTEAVTMAAPNAGSSRSLTASRIDPPSAPACACGTIDACTPQARSARCSCRAATRSPRSARCEIAMVIVRATTKGAAPAGATSISRGWGISQDSPWRPPLAAVHGHPTSRGYHRRGTDGAGTCPPCSGRRPPRAPRLAARRVLRPALEQEQPRVYQRMPHAEA